MSENTPNNPSQGAAGGYGYDAGARPAQDASLPAQPQQPVQSSQQGNAAQPAAPAAPQQPVQPQQAPQPTPASAHAQPNAEAQAAPAQPGQPAAAPQPGTAQPGAAQPGQPGQATYAPSAPHPAVKALGATWNAFLDVFSSNPATAHARISSAGVWGWIVPTTLQALAGAFFFSQLVILAATVAMSMMGYMYGRGGAYGGAYASHNHRTKSRGSRTGCADRTHDSGVRADGSRHLWCAGSARCAAAADRAHWQGSGILHREHARGVGVFFGADSFVPGAEPAHLLLEPHP